MARGLDPRLRSVAGALDRMGWAADLCAPDWTLCWASRELRTILRADEPDRLGLGEHTVAARFRPAFRQSVDDEGMFEWLRWNAPRMAPGTPGGLEAVLAMVPPEFRDGIEALDGPPETTWTGHSAVRQLGLAPARVRYLVTALHDEHGERTGWMTIYGGAIPASLLAVVARGRRSMFARMADLIEPARHEAAVLFADIQSSGRLSRQLATARWFELIVAFNTEVDELVIDHGGIVGRHAGDGVTAFFLADQCGGRSGACAAALHTARGVVGFDPDLYVNAGVHWGGAIYIGQVVTGGRLEVTAIGDEVNEAARIQQTARDGQLLVSKAVVERLEPADATALSLRPETLTYELLADLPGASTKAIRDAGMVSVVDLSRP